PDWRHYLAVAVVEHVVHAPRIGAEAGDGQLARSGFLQTGIQLGEQSFDVPMQLAVLALHRPVREAVQFFERNFSAIERAEHEPPALRAEVAGKVVCGHNSFLPSAWRSLRSSVNVSNARPRSA